MRLIASLLFAFLLVPSSGCIFSCSAYDRKFVWEQDDVPLRPSGLTTEHELGDLWGGISRSRDDNKLRVQVFGHDPVSHSEGVSFVESLFVSKDWPDPRLENADESAGCGDHF